MEINIQYTLRDILRKSTIKLVFPKYPNGEFNISLPYCDLREIIGGENIIVKISTNIKSCDDLFKLALVKKSLNSFFNKNNIKTFISLNIFYMIYQRQDRIFDISSMDIYSQPLKYICELINNLNFDAVYLNYPHSDVTGGMINNSIVQYPFLDILDFYPELKDEIEFYVSPDAGSEKLVSQFSKKHNKRLMLFRKVRDFNGDIIATQCINDCDLKNKTVIIVDDLCDGGRTFIEIAKILKEKGVSKISLYVCHGLFTKGFDVFKGYIDDIYYNNLSKIEHKTITE